MFELTRRRLASLAVLTAVLILPRAGAAQVNTFQACSQGVLQDCATIRLTQESSTLFQIAIQNLGSTSLPTIPTSIYSLVFFTGQVATPDVSLTAIPIAEGGASIFDATPWNVDESGDAIFLSAAGNDGIGGHVLGATVATFGQMAQTDGADAFVTFTFSTSSAIDPNTLTLADIEFAGLVARTDGFPLADSCNPDTPCLISSRITATPEPATIVLMLTGFSGIAGVRLRRRNAPRARATTLSEA